MSDKPVKHCPFCGSANLKFVGSYGGVPRCMDCRTVFLVSYQRPLRKSPARNDPTLRDICADAYKQRDAEIEGLAR